MTLNLSSSVRGGGSLNQGCLGTLLSSVVSVVLLVINGALVVAIYAGLAAENSWMTDLRFAQLVFFVAPVLLLVLQRLLIDILVDGVSRLHHRNPADSEVSDSEEF